MQFPATNLFDLLTLQTGSNLGYANEVGEAFRSLVHRHWVTASYGVATAYVLGDTVDKTKKADKIESAKPTYMYSRVIAAGAGTLIWQSLASVIIPGFTINRICALTLYSLTKFTKLPKTTKKWTTTAVGLGMINRHYLPSLLRFLVLLQLKRKLLLVTLHWHSFFFCIVKEEIAEGADTSTPS